MKNKKYYPHITGMQNVKGFSLLEFLVASALSMIVLLAAGKGYFTARQLNEAAGARMGVQQDLRNAANMVVRDARMAGSFGCFNMAADTEQFDVRGGTMGARAVTGSRTIRDTNDAAFGLTWESAVNSLMPVRQVAGFSPDGFTPDTDALVFLYGAENPADGDPFVLSTCYTLMRGTGGTVPTAGNAGTTLGGTAVRNGEVSVLRYAAYAYAVGTIGGQRGLFRFQLNNNNTWGNPQLLVADVTGARFRYIYVNNCPNDDSPSERFEYSENLNRIPAFVRIELTGGAEDVNQIYTIDAAVRGGNTCANRSLS